MGLFFNRKKKEIKPERLNFPWQDLTTLDMLEGIVEASHSRPQVIFKHSTSCGTSRMVKLNFESDFSRIPNDMDFHYLDLFSYRPVSNAVSDIFRIKHESPQLIVVKNGEVVAHASHDRIMDVNLWDYKN